MTEVTGVQVQHDPVAMTLTLSCPACTGRTVSSDLREASVQQALHGFAADHTGCGAPPALVVPEQRRGRRRRR